MKTEKMNREHQGVAKSLLLIGVVTAVVFLAISWAANRPVNSDERQARGEQIQDVKAEIGNKEINEA